MLVFFADALNTAFDMKVLQEIWRSSSYIDVRRMHSAVFF